ncbi:MAG: ABC-2 transporter permease [Candidatus Ornithospirochaeta sp.]
MIKALLYKDMIAVKKYARTMLIVGILSAFIIKGPGASLILMIYASSLLLTTMALDERERFLSRIISDKGRSGKIIAEKYILLFLLVAASVVVAAALEVVMALVYKNPFSLYTILSTVLPGLFLVSFSGGTAIPVTLKFGAEKARLILFVCYLIPAAGMVFLLGKMGEVTPGLAPIAMLSIGASTFVVLASYFVTLSVFRNKDF